MDIGEQRVRQPVARTVLTTFVTSLTAIVLDVKMDSLDLLVQKHV